MDGLYGPRTPEVERFLSRLERLTPGQCRLVSRGTAARVRYLSEARRAADAAALRYDRTPAVESAWAAVEQALQPARVGDDPEVFDLAALAASALILRDLITWPDFELLYQPFFQVIPLRSLKRTSHFGPRTREVRRFLRRIERLSEQQWQPILATHLLRPLGPVPLPDAWQRESESAQVEAAVSVGRSWDRASQTADVSPSARTFARHAAQDAAAALVVRDWLAPATFAALYAPFSWSIPLRALSRRFPLRLSLSEPPSPCVKGQG